MPAPTDLIDPTLRLVTVLDATAKYAALVAIGIGAMGWVIAGNNVRRSMRFRGMFVGGIVALLAIFGISTVYETIRFIMGTQFLPPGWPYGVSGMGSIAALGAAVAGMLHHLGLAVFSIGMALHAIAAPYSRGRQRGRKWVAIGLAMIALSVGSNLFTVFALVL
ncbi:hypothetical protein ACOZ4N_00900 (plasmid) [Halorientalis pallida]|uniref:hypothetical protein n=1 Tax=Halorientalis pallida TaxID=2479928 RepID=UPI003C6F0774